MKKLRINRATARNFGRLGNESVTFADSDFVVVTGPNEAGKSTLADLLSWVLAGRRGNNGTETRFVDFRNRDAGASSVTIAGQLDGVVGEQSFSVNRGFIIRSTNQGREPTPPVPTIFLDGTQIPSENWGQLIGVLTGDQFYNQYRITGPYDPSNQVDVMVLLEALTVGTSVAVPPRAVITRLEAEADRLVHPASGRNSGQRLFRIATDRHDDARERRRQIERDFSRSTELEGHIRSAGEGQVRLEDELRQLREEQEALETASELLTLAVDGKAAAEDLAKLQVIDADLQHAHTVAADISATISRLETAIESEITAAQLLNDAVRIVGIDLAEASGVVVPNGTLDEVTVLLSDRRSAEQEITLAVTAEEESRVRLGTLNESLSRLAEELCTTSEHLLSIGTLTLNDASFGDPLRNWVEAEREVPNLESASKTASEREDSCQREFDRIDGMWTETGLEAAPQLVAEGQVYGAVRGGPQRPVGLALVVLMTAAAAFVHRAAGVVAAVVGLGILWEMSRRPNAKSGGPVGDGLTKNEMSLAQDWVKAKVNLEAAVNARRGVEAALLGHHGQLPGFKAVASEVLFNHGFGEDVNFNLAAKIRAERAAIKEVVRKIADESGISATAEARRTRNEGLITRINSDLAGIAAEIGLGRFGDGLTAEKVQAARDLQGKVLELNTARLAVSRMWDELRQLAGPWSVSLSIGEIKRTMADIAKAMSIRKELEDKKRASEISLESRAPRGSRAAELLDDPSMTPNVFTVRREEIERLVSAKKEERDAELKRAGALTQELAGLANQDDLPLVQQELEQAENELSDVAVRGAALLVAAKIVLDVKDEVERANQPAVIKRASDLAISITGGQWTGLAIAEDGQIAAGQNGLWMDQVSLSAGARDVLRLCVRIAFAEHHAEKTGVALPLILDDPTASVDSSRAPRLFDVLAEFSTRHQVILMTHDPVTVEHALSVGAAIVNLPVQN
jgi:energy-coupling factor transporter ATP-binding protein EcfA2